MVLPGLTAVVERPPAPPEPLRSDIAVFAGRTLRGPVGVATPVAGWREYQARYGGLADRATPYAVQAYFDNGGELAWLLRLEGPEAVGATGRWVIGEVTDQGVWAPEAPSRAGFQTDVYRIEATSPGSWANGIEVRFELRVMGSDGRPELDVRVTVPGQQPEHFDRLAPETVAQSLTASGYIRLHHDGVATIPVAGPTPGPQAAVWIVTLDGGSDDRPTVAEYLAGAGTMADLDEPALVTMPDLNTDLLSPFDRAEVTNRVVGDAAASLDRLVLLDVPPDRLAPGEAASWADELRSTLGDPQLWRAAAVYHPPLRVADPLGGPAQPLRTIPPGGGVAGVVSRLDRERGPHHTPANAVIYEATDVVEVFDRIGQDQLYRAGINNLRCTPGRGIEIWGGRTLDRDPPGSFVAHRRLLHRLVRAAHRVAEPLVFDVNGPELWLTVVRALTTVLLEAYRSGGLKGLTPEEAFRVQCDEELNPPTERDDGRVLCLVSLAPASPMEFIVLRLTFGLQGALEVVEA